ncbi:Rossmann-like and DUF2520 domain-containing protein [Pseudorhodoferax sp.]|uniref:Rossmann-like and DUF2520 domain-containing protein n=1 Tax=Pseudorhodoferax sp. TaxID=1993553 RepID=UPI0039E6F1C8
MDLDRLSIGFVGCGRLAKALAWHAAERGLRVAGAASRLHSEAEELAQRLPGCAVLDAQAVADRCDLVFVTTPDETIESAARAVRWRRGTFAVHCSGATKVSALAKAAADGAHIGGFHPLQTFGDPEAAARSLPGCTVTVEAAQPLDALLVALAQRLGCAVNRLPPGARPLYHAAAGYTSQFVNALLHEAAAMWQSWGASEESAVRALLPLVRGTVASIAQAGLAQGMPGPVSRGDVASVRKHVQALERFGADSVPLYRALCERTVVLALAGHRIDAATAQRVRGVLAQAGRPEPSRAA